jgi:hypothetical protein
MCCGTYLNASRLSLVEVTPTSPLNHLVSLSANRRRAYAALALGYLRLTLAISGSRPWTNHTDRFYRESAASLRSALLAITRRDET